VWDRISFLEDDYEAPTGSVVLETDADADNHIAAGGLGTVISSVFGVADGSNAAPNFDLEDSNWERDSNVGVTSTFTGANGSMDNPSNSPTLMTASQYSPLTLAGFASTSALRFTHLGNGVYQFDGDSPVIASVSSDLYVTGNGTATFTFAIGIDGVAVTSKITRTALTNATSSTFSISNTVLLQPGETVGIVATEDGGGTTNFTVEAFTISILGGG
jgi:hypothetical protein